MKIIPSLNYKLCLFISLILLPFSALSAVHEITVGDNFFQDADGNTSTTIQVGDTVRWINAAGGNPHDVTSNNGAFTASPTASSFTFEVTFNEAGTFAYFCTVHPFMTGIITVVAAAAELDLQSVDAASGTYGPEDLLTIDSSIMNSGSADSGSFSIDYYASSDSDVTTEDRLLGSANVSNIAMGESLNHQAMINVPGSIPGGEYFIGAIINFSDSNQENNTNVDAAVVTFLGQFFINAGLNDAWVSAGAPFQGFFFTVFEEISLLFLAWFTFDSVVPEGEDTAVFGAFDQRWITGANTYNQDSVTVSVELTSGGIFNGSDPEAVQSPEYGTITITFLNCNEAILTYDFPSSNLSGQMTLSRVVLDNVALCETLNEILQNAPP